MFCPACGKQSSPNVNFCSSCGAAALPLPTVAARARIVRPRSPRMIAGVCSGIAIHFGWNVALVRILAAVFAVLTHGVGLLCYVLAWILLPDAQYALPGRVNYMTGYPAGYQPQPVQTPGQNGQGTPA